MTTLSKSDVAASLVSIEEQKLFGRVIDDIAAAVTVPLVTATAAELNKLSGATVTTTEINTLASEAASVTMATTPASGTCAVQLTFKDAAGVALAHAVSGLLYWSAVDGLSIANPTSAAVLTNGALTELVAGKVDHFITTAAGLLGITVTKAGGGTYYASIVLPNGKIITTGAIVVNA